MSKCPKHDKNLSWMACTCGKSPKPRREVRVVNGKEYEKIGGKWFRVEHKEVKASDLLKMNISTPQPNDPIVLGILDKLDGWAKCYYSKYLDAFFPLGWTVQQHESELSRPERWVSRAFYDAMATQDLGNLLTTEENYQKFLDASKSIGQTKNPIGNLALMVKKQVQRVRKIREEIVALSQDELRKIILASVIKGNFLKQWEQKTGRIVDLGKIDENARDFVVEFLSLQPEDAVTDIFETVLDQRNVES